MDAIIVILLILALISVGVFFAMRERVKLRHILYDRREARIGKMIWSEIVHEGSTSTSVSSKRVSMSDISGLLSLNESIRAGGLFPGGSSGMISYVWLRHPDGSIHLYVGVSEAYYGDGSAVRVAAETIHARAVRQANPPNVPTAAIAIARLGKSTPSALDRHSEGSGHLVDAFSTAIKNMPSGETAAIVITMEPLYDSESRKITENVVKETNLNSGQDSMLFSASSSATPLVNGAMRASIVAAISLDQQRAVSGVLNTALTSVPSLGWQTPIKTYSGSKIHEGMRERLAKGEILIPRYVMLNPRYQFQSRVYHEIARPSPKQVLYLNPLALFECLSFPERFSSGGVDVHKGTTLSRGLPSNMVHVDWPSYWGQSGTGQPVFQDLSDMHYALFTAGAPGSGKTNFLQVIFAGAVKSCIEQHAGLQITPIWGETKGEGAEDSWLIAKRHPNAIFVDTHNPLSTHRLSLEGPRLSDGAGVDEIMVNVSNLVSGMQFAWGDGIRSASRELLDHSIRISMLLLPSEIDYLELSGFVNIDKPNVMDLAFYILGGDYSIQPGGKLLTIRDDHVKTGAMQTDQRVRELCDSIGSISRFLEPRSRKNFETQISSPLNKLSDLRNARLAWEPNERKDTYVPAIPSRFAPVVINMGPYRKPDGTYSSMQQAISRRLLLMTNYLLWDTIKSNCSGWQKAGKRISLFFDEVADIAVNAQSDDVTNVLADALKEGRSRGTAYYVGCQSPAQMPYQASHSVLGSRSKFWFGLHEAEDLNLAVNDLASGNRSEQPYTQENIRGIPDGTCVGIMKRKDTVTPAFTLRVPYAMKWAELLLRTGVSVEDAVVDYLEWADTNSSEVALPSDDQNEDIPLISP